MFGFGFFERGGLFFSAFVQHVEQGIDGVRVAFHQLHGAYSGGYGEVGQC